MRKYVLGMLMFCFLFMTAVASQAMVATKLFITMIGTGRGLVSADTGTIVWSGLTGTADYTYLTPVTLTAQPNDGISFMGWSGACTGTGVCSLTIDSTKSVTALFSAVPRTGQTTAYSAGDDGNMQAGTPWPDPRFTLSSSGTGTVVADGLTGLVWPQDGGTPTLDVCTGGTTTWQGALNYVSCLNSKNYLGHNDWRLPNINELQSLANKGQAASWTWLNERGFTNAKDQLYWSSTTYGLNTSYAYRIDMAVGTAQYSGKANEVSPAYVWPVRSGPCGSSGASAICLPKTGQTICYDSLSSVIACSGTGQDGDVQAGVSWPSSRFTPVSAGTGTLVIDNLSGLIWTQNVGTPTLNSCTGGSMTWQAALDYVACLNMNTYLGHTDWRLPNANELSSIMNSGQSELDSWQTTQGFINTQDAFYWSATTYASNFQSAWIVALATGNVTDFGKGTSQYVWPVRGGQPVPLAYLTISKSGAGSGAVTLDKGGILWSGNTGTVSYGIAGPMSVLLNAVPDSGSAFTGWTGDADCSDGQVLMNGDRNCTATFTPIHTVTASAGTHGTLAEITPSPALVNEGSTIQFEFNANTGYHVANISGCSGTPHTNSLITETTFTYTTGTIASDCTVTALFAINPVYTYTVTPVSRSFGNQLINTISTAQTFTIKNTGNQPLAIMSTSITGTNLNEFARTINCPTGAGGLSAGSSCTISVTFNPATTGVKKASLVIEMASPAMTKIIALNGMGTAPVTKVTPATLPSYGNQLINTVSTPKAVKVTNTGTAPLFLKTSFTGSNPGQFAQVSTCPTGTAGLATGATCTISIMFKPTAIGLKNASLQVTVSLPAVSKTIALSGMGTAPIATVIPKLLSFGTQTKNSTSAAKSVKVTNTGTAPLFLSTSITGTNPKLFAQISTCPTGTTGLATGASCTISVTFKPTTVGAKQASLAIDVAKPAVSKFVALTGEGK